MSMGYVTCPSPMGGVLWKGDLAAHDVGFTAVRAFIDGHMHKGWTLSIYDAVTGGAAEIDCELPEIPEIVAYVYNLEHAAPMLVVGESPVTESYVVGMTCTRGRIAIPGMCKAEDGKLVDTSAR